MCRTNIFLKLKLTGPPHLFFGIGRKLQCFIKTKKNAGAAVSAASQIPYGTFVDSTISRSLTKGNDRADFQL